MATKKRNTRNPDVDKIIEGVEERSQEMSSFVFFLRTRYLSAFCLTC